MDVASAPALSGAGLAPEGRFPEIGDYALIGNGRTAALVSRDGAIEWMCVPVFSGASIFGAMLDRQGGHFAVHPVAPFQVTRRYVDGTNVLESEFHTDRGVMRLSDCMTLAVAPAGELYPQHEVLRRIEILEGEVEVEVSFAPRPGYGRSRAGFSDRGRMGWQLTGVPFGAFVHSELPFARNDGDARLLARARLAKGDVRWVSFTYDQDEASVIMPLADEAQHRLDQTVAWWRQWSSRCRYDGPHRDLVLRGALVLKLMTCSTSGAVLAAPTTSLPEEAGGARNWDYRYCWIRDSALTLHAFLALGYVEEAESFLEWLLHATRLTWERFQVMYDLYGETKLDEKELPYWSGYRGARPVRIGNAAHDQLQLDIYGELLETLWMYVEAGGELGDAECRMLAGVGRRVLDLWRLPDQGIWEIRSGPRHHTFSKAMCWVTIDRLRRIGERFPLPLARDRLNAACDEIRAEIETRGFNEKLGSYVACYDSEEADASLLLLARYGYAKPGEPRMQGTFEYIRRTLVRDRLVQRYRPESYADGVHGGENAFAPCSFWAVEYLANAGEHERARKGFERLAGYANDVGLFGEEFEWTTGAPMGNFPQAFTHVSLISAAIALFRQPTA
jgi:GH15 family glucan-1,4-alpha-glucosidase